MPRAIRITSASGALTVNLTGPSGATPVVYTDSAFTTTTSLPATVTSGGTSTFWLQSPGAYSLSVKTSTGTEIASDNNSPRTVDLETSGTIAALTYDTRFTHRIEGDSGRGSDTGDTNAAYLPVGSPLTRAGNLAVFWGDSIMAGADGASTHQEAWPVYATLVSQQRIRYVFNAGVAGQTSTSILARFATDVAAYSPNVVFIMAGTNDPSNSITLTTTIANIKAMVTAVNGIGAKAVLCTIPPNSLGTPTDRRELIVAENAWIRRYAAQQGLTVCDFYNLLVDPANANYLAAYNVDGTHPNAAGQLAMANLANSIAAPLMPGNGAPLLCSDAVDEANLITNGVFNGVTGSALPSPWGDNAGTPTGSVISYTTDANVPGKLMTFTMTASSGTRQVGYQFNLPGADTMPAVSAGATSFSLTKNPFTKGVLFIGDPTSGTYEVAKVSSVSGSGPYTVTVTHGLRYAHTAGEQVIANGIPGDLMAYSGLVTTDGGVAVTTRCDISPSGTFQPLSAFTQPMTRAVWYQEFTIPVGATAVAQYLQMAAGTGVTSFGRIGVYNLTRMNVI